MNNSEKEMLRQWNRTFERSYPEIKQKAMPEQTRVIFENLSLLQKSIQHNWSSQKRDSTYQENSNTNTLLEEEHASPKNQSAPSRKLFQQNSL
jgi:galactokinase/mevalonate kinase-like predicted kinase